MNGVMRSVWLAVHALIAVPVVWVWLQTLFAGRSTKAFSEQADDQSRPHDQALVVLIPAHNEGRGLVPTLESLRAQLRDGDRLLVVADNCQDDTADVARECGALVIERRDTSRRGKGWALDFGVQHLKSQAAGPTPAFVMIFDADCVMLPGGVDRVVAHCASIQRPVQAMTLMTVAPGSGMQQRFAEFAWRMKNKARPLGGRNLGAPCQLTGTGMVFPWSIIVKAPLASSNIVEDMQMGVDLALKGHLPRFEPLAILTSKFPDSSEGAQSQRARWEHGHMATLLHAGPQLVAAGVRRLSPALIIMGIDLMVPPLALLVMALVGLVLIDLAWWAFWGWATASWVSLGLLSMFTMAILLTWWRHGEGTITGRELLMAPLYALRKIPLYVAFVFKRQTEWVRAKRDGE